MAPIAQHRGGDAKLACNLHQRPTAARQQGDRLHLELIRKMTPFLAHSTPSRSPRSLAKVSTNSGEAQYQPLKAHLRWTLQNLVSFADRTGRCFPSVRKLAASAGLSKSAASRHLRDLVEAGVITRKRRPGSVYEYEIDPRFLPRAPVSRQR